MGAWIETFMDKKDILIIAVAPYVGAWIATNCQHQRMICQRVAPYVGAWIETPLLLVYS